MSQTVSIYEIHDERFKQMIVPSADLDELYSGCRWAEGPVWFNDLNCLLWSDIPNQRILRWVPEGGVSVFRNPSNFSNGNTRDREGRLVTCEHGAVASPARNRMAASPCWPTAIRAKAQCAERCCRALGWNGVVHRSDLRHSGGL